jgi:hypothetical protein
VVSSQCRLLSKLNTGNEHMIFAFFARKQRAFVLHLLPFANLAWLCRKASVWLLFGRNSETRCALCMDWHPSASHSPFLQSTSHERSCQLKKSTAVPRLDCELSIRGEQVLCTDHHCGLTTQHRIRQQIFHELHRVSNGTEFCRILTSQSSAF